MSPAARAFHQRLERRAAALAPEIRSGLFKGFARLRALLSDADLEAFIRTPAAERLLGEAITEAEIEAAFAPVSRTIRDGVETAARLLAREVPGAVRGAHLNVLSPSVVDAVQALNTRVITGLSETTREAIRQAVARGLAAGKAPKAIAKDLRALVGLSSNREQWVANFRAELERGDLAALQRELRDARFDAGIRRAFEAGGLTPEKIDQLVETYRKNQIASHAETIARTVSLDAQRLAQRLTWQGAIDRGEVDGNRLMRRYSGVLDEKEREEHLLLEGEVVRWDEPYSSGQMYAGEGDFNCRCLDILFVASDPVAARRPSAGARGLTPDQLRVASLLQQLNRPS